MLHGGRFCPLARVGSAFISGLHFPLKSTPHFCVLPRQMCSLSTAWIMVSLIPTTTSPPPRSLRGLHSPPQRSWEMCHWDPFCLHWLLTTKPVSASVPEVSLERVPFSLVLWRPMILILPHWACRNFYQFLPLCAITEMQPHVLHSLTFQAKLEVHIFM